MDKKIDYSKALNPAQHSAVNTKKGPILVIAGAGSGKTRTLTYRAAKLVEAGVPPGSILLLSFTRKASREMLKRASLLLDSRCERISGGTFHSFANTVLRRYTHILGLEPDYAIIDRADAESLIEMIRKDFLRHRSPGYRLPNKRTLAGIFSKAVNKSKSLEEILTEAYLHLHEAHDAIIDIALEYQNRKAQNAFVDYDDLLVYLHRLLSGHPEVRTTLRAKYHYIMVDEYQDTNRLQAQIITLLAGSLRNVMVVGDDAQSIYAFRGANFRNIMDFPEQFPGTTIIKLEENYRSTQAILNLTNRIIDQASERYAKRLFSRGQTGNPPLLVCAENENAQSMFVIDNILSLMRNGIPLDQIAVLFRAGFHAFDLEIELGREKIPFIKVGGFKFMESAHIKDLLAHLKVIVSPRDRLSWYRILTLLDKIGPSSARAIYGDVLTEGKGFRGILNVTSGYRSEGLPSLKDLYAALDPTAMTVSSMGEAVMTYYTPLLKTHYDDYPKRLKDLEHLLSIMERYHDLNAFLADMSLEPPNTVSDGTLEENESRPDRLTLSTIHSAKGLEWHTVFILWALDGRFPSFHSLDDRETLDEELRLMYVAATRAKRSLYFIYPAQFYDKSTQMLLSEPSRFLHGIPGDILEKRFFKLS